MCKDEITRIRSKHFELPGGVQKKIPISAKNGTLMDEMFRISRSFARYTNNTCI